MSEKHIGEVVQVTGPVLDIRFAHDELPALLNAIEIDNQGAKLTAEVAQQVGDNTVRCIAMNSTDGLVRGAKAVDTGSSISVPVGEECLGRVFNLLGDPVDNKPAPETKERWSIHRPAPAYEEQTPATEILETGIKVVDLICPYAKGGKIGLFGGAGVGKTVLIMELTTTWPRLTAVFPYLRALESVPVREMTFTMKCRRAALSTRPPWYMDR